MENQEYRVGSLVRTRGRDWVVLPSNDENLVLLQPLGGSEDEITGIYLPLNLQNDNITSSEFPAPNKNDLGNISSAKLLYDAVRLSFRNGAGPFRSLAKISFRPRAYQIVPLIMALRIENPVRLFIADDVGIGKTIEALLILKEFLERKIISRFAIIVLPHLCEQWQSEIKDKFGIDAVIIRSNTQSRLDREIQGDTSVYHYYPYQIISIDYIKSEQRRQVFIQECPEFIIVDEVHSCSRPGGVKHSVQQQRYNLIKDIAAKENQHLILLTATPHSGKIDQFSSLLGFIDDKYKTIDLSAVSRAEREKLAKHYVQRRRADVEKWMNEDTPFPIRDSVEIPYELSKKYSQIYSQTVHFALGLTEKKDSKSTVKRMRYWSALALLRGVISSPAAGVDMLNNKLNNLPADDIEINKYEEIDNPLLDDESGAEKDPASAMVIAKTIWSDSEIQKISKLKNELSNLANIKFDNKAGQTLQILKDWLKKGFNPVIFCRYIATAKYIGEIIKNELPKIIKDVEILIITSEDPDEVRKSKIEDMSDTNPKVLIATDCLSEGINLQTKFSAVLHYDLPWNPNRLEQREGRVDRFGQLKNEVKTLLLYSKDNSIDGVVLNVLLRKIREIRKSTGISIPFPEDSQSLLDTVFQAVMEKSQTKNQEMDQLQLELDYDELQYNEKIITQEIEKAAEREKATRSIFAQHSIKAQEIEQDLIETDEAIGNPETVENFVVNTLTQLLGVQIDKYKNGYLLYPNNLPDNLKIHLPNENKIKVSFFSPTPEGYLYLGRNCGFVENLCHYLIGNAINRFQIHRPARSAVIKSANVDIKTTIIMFRVRNVIQEKFHSSQLVAEEMLLFGYKGNAENNAFLEIDEIRHLLDTVIPSCNLSDEAKNDFLEYELNNIKSLTNAFDKIAFTRSEILIEAHERFRKIIAGKRYKVVEPVLPMDLMGIYILLPDKNL